MGKARSLPYPSLARLNLNLDHKGFLPCAFALTTAISSFLSRYYATYDLAVSRKAFSIP